MLCDVAVCGVVFHLLTSLTCSVVSSFKCLLQNGWQLCLLPRGMDLRAVVRSTSVNCFAFCLIFVLG